MQRKIIAVDFDGTLCESKYPLIGEPKQQVIDYIKAMKAQGHTIILWTCRRGVFLEKAKRWCKSNGVIFDYINKNAPSLIKAFNGDCRKIYADVYIDDKAVNVREIDENNRVSKTII